MRSFFKDRLCLLIDLTPHWILTSGNSFKCRDCKKSHLSFFFISNCKDFRFSLLLQPWSSSSVCWCLSKKLSTCSMWEKPQKVSHLSFQKLTESWKNKVCNNKNNREWFFVPFVTIFGQNGQTVDNYILKSKTSYFCYFYCKILRWFIGQKSSKAPSKHSTDHRAVTTQIISAITIVKIQFGQNIDLERFEKNKSKNKLWFDLKIAKNENCSFRI